MLFSGSPFSSSAFSAASRDSGADPRTLVALVMPASGGAVFAVSAEFDAGAEIAVVGGLDSPLVRIRRTSGALPGIGSLAADVSVSPVMVTLDGSGGMVVALGYVQARVRGRMAAGGGAVVNMGAGRLLQSVLAADGGMDGQVFEYHKAAAAFAAGGGMAVLGGNWTTLEAVLAASGGMVADTAYDLFGPVITVVARGSEGVAVLARGSADDIVVLEVEHEGIIVVSEGI